MDRECIAQASGAGPSFAPLGSASSPGDVQRDHLVLDEMLGTDCGAQDKCFVDATHSTHDAEAASNAALALGADTAPQRGKVEKKKKKRRERMEALAEGHCFPSADADDKLLEEACRQAAHEMDATISRLTPVRLAVQRVLEEHTGRCLHGHALGAVINEPGDLCTCCGLVYRAPDVAAGCCECLSISCCSKLKCAPRRLLDAVKIARQAG